MIRYAKILFVFATLSAICVSAYGQISVYAGVDSRQDVYLGDDFILQVIIDGYDAPGEVDISSLAGMNPRLAGQSDLSQRSISIINGKRSEKVTKRYVMQYKLRANKKPKIHIPALDVGVEGKVYKTKPFSVDVLLAEKTDKLELEVKLSKDSCYVGQPVIMTVNFYIRADIGNFTFHIPAFETDDFVLADPPERLRQAKEFDIGNGTHVFVNQRRLVRDGKQVVLLSFKKALLPQRAGEIQIEPASVSAEVDVGGTRSRDGFFGDIFSKREYKRCVAASDSLILEVKSLPEVEAPASFYGLVGSYNIETSASPTKVCVGDPITFTIKITGDFLEAVRRCELEKIDVFKNNFTMPEQWAPAVIENGAKVYTQTIRASNNNVTNIGSIELSYFDADTGKYAVAKSDVIELDVTKTTILTSADMKGDSQVKVDHIIEAIKEGMSANYQELDAVCDMEFRPAEMLFSMPYGVLWIGPLVLFLVSGAVRIVTYKTPQGMAAKRRKNAAGKAKKAIKNLRNTNSDDRGAKLADALKQYIAQRFDKVAGSLTAADCRLIIQQNTQDDVAADAFGDLVEKCQAGRYSPLGGEIDEKDAAGALELVVSVDRSCRK
jgi:hypothetical protein